MYRGQSEHKQQPGSNRADQILSPVSPRRSRQSRELNQSEFIKRGEQSRLDSSRSAGGFRTLGEATKIERHRSLVFESRGASFTAVAMPERFLARVGIDDLFASYLIDDVFKVLAIHAKHLDD